MQKQYRNQSELLANTCNRCKALKNVYATKTQLLDSLISHWLRKLARVFFNLSQGMKPNFKHTVETILNLRCLVNNLVCRHGRDLHVLS